MKIKPPVEECTNLIIGAYSASSFYEEFDKILYKNNAPINPTELKKRLNLLKKIQAHWNNQNSKDFDEFTQKNISLIKSLLKEHSIKYKDFIKAINIKGIQNTKISKILHIINPETFPMMDPKQGEFLIGKYDKKSREDLILAFERFHEQYKINFQKVRKIREKLSKNFNIEISDWSEPH